VTLSLTRSGPTTAASTVRLTSADGTAASPFDFTAVDRTVTFEAGAATAHVTVAVRDDVVGESPDETFTVALSDPEGAVLGDVDTVTVTIVDDDSAACYESASVPSFGDVGGDNVHAASVACLAELGVTTGATADSYDPSAPVSRAQMAGFLARVVETVGGTLPAAPPDAFGDDDGTTHELAINQLAAAGIVTGTDTPGVFDPSGTVSRAQMAAFLVRTWEFVTGETAPAGTDAFADDDGLALEPAINSGAALGLYVGTDSGFGPTELVRRDQMATFVVRLLNALSDAGHPPV
jgi:hypothetical protein